MAQLGPQAGVSDLRMSFGPGQACHTSHWGGGCTAWLGTKHLPGSWAISQWPVGESAESTRSALIWTSPDSGQCIRCLHPQETMAPTHGPQGLRVWTEGDQNSGLRDAGPGLPSLMLILPSPAQEVGWVSERPGPAQPGGSGVAGRSLSGPLVSCRQGGHLPLAGPPLTEPCDFVSRELRLHRARLGHRGP